MSHYILFSNENHERYALSTFCTGLFEADDGKEYYSAEQYIVKKKQELFDPKNKLLGKNIMNTCNNRAYQLYDRDISNYDENIWKSKAYNIMYEANYLKFSQNYELYKFLHETENKEIIEYSKNKIYGSGISYGELTGNGHIYPGENMLGKVLSQIRLSYREYKHHAQLNVLHEYKKKYKLNKDSPINFYTSTDDYVRKIKYKYNVEEQVNGESFLASGAVPLKNDNNFIIDISFKNYIDDIMKSYGNSLEKVDAQFEKDFPRENVFLDNKQYDSIERFMTDLESNTKIFGKSIGDMDYKALIILLCCQSSFFLPYYLLSKLYGTDQNSERILVCESMGQIQTNILISFKKNKIILVLKTSLYIKHMDTNTQTNKIDIMMTIEFASGAALSASGAEKNKSLDHQMCVFSWNNQKIEKI